MTAFHVFRAKDQPAVRYKIVLDVPNGRVTLTERNPARRLFRCFSCKERHRAENMIAHVYYDGTYFFCRKGRGCKT